MSTHFMDSHLNFRVSSHDKRLVETAAKLRGLKSNTYARQKLIDAAEKDIAELSQLNSLVLSPNEWDAFMNIMEAPIEINPNLKKAVNSFRKTLGH